MAASWEAGAEASSLGWSRKLGCRHLEFPSPGPQDADSCTQPPRLPLPHLRLALTSCLQGRARPAVGQECRWSPWGLQGNLSQGQLKPLLGPRVFWNSRKTTAGSPFDRLENRGLELAKLGRSDPGGPCSTPVPSLLGLMSLAHENVAHGALSPLPSEMVPCPTSAPISFVQKAREALGLHRFLCQTPHFSKPHFAIPAKCPLQRIVVKNKDDNGNNEKPRPSTLSSS